MSTPTGDCYRSAALYVLLHEKNAREKGIDLKLVHGWPIGTGGEVEGKRYGHAWAEYAMAGLPLVCVNCDGEEEKSIVAAVYYAAGQIDSELCVKYSRYEMLRMMEKTQHYGPWTEGPEDAVG